MSAPSFDITSISTVIGLGNPGKKFELTRHNIGFLLLDHLAERYGGRWQQGPHCEWTQVQVASDGQMHMLRLVKPQTFMNSSGDVWPWLAKQGGRAEKTLVVHDELEKKFGKMMIRLGGSARGHNGLRSFINRIGHDFWRLRIGIDRPENKHEVASYVLRPFAPAEMNELEGVLDAAAQALGL